MDPDGQYLNQVAHAVADLAAQQHIHTITNVGAYRDAVIRETRATKRDHIQALLKRAENEDVTLTVDDVAAAIHRGLTIDELERDKAVRDRLAALDAEIGRNRQQRRDDPPPAILEPDMRPDGSVTDSPRLTKHTVKVGLDQVRTIRNQLKQEGGRR